MVRAIRLFVSLTDKVSLILVRVSGIAALVLMLVVTYEVIMRYVFHSPTRWGFEVSTYLLVICIFLAVPYTQREGKHIKVDLAIHNLSERKKLVLNVIACALGLIFCIVLTWQSWQSAWYAYSMGYTSGSTLAVPLFPFMMFVPIGSFFLSLQLLNEIGRSILFTKEE